MSTAGKYPVFRTYELLATLVLAAAACWAVYPANRLTELVLADGNSPVSVKYLESIVRLNPGNSRYRMLLADRYIATGRHGRAMAQLLEASATDPETVFGRDVRILALYGKAPQYFRNGREADILSARTLAAIRAETSRRRLGEQYAETAALGIWPAAQAAAERILQYETWNRYYWLIRAAEAAENGGLPQAAAAHYLAAARAAPDLDRRRRAFRKTFLVLAAAGSMDAIKWTISDSAADFAGDRITAATLLSFARQTGDPYFARDIALVILRSRR